jgi:carboxypeptidase C (cathepsin A)
VARDGLQQSPLFLTGESYGGTYMPRLAKRLIDTKAKVKIGGVVIVDGWVDPETQTGSSAEFALTHGLIDASQKRSLDRVHAQCRAIIRRHGTRSLEAAKVCQSIQDKIATMSGRWLANIGQLADVSYAPVEAYLNRPDVRAALHAQPGGTFSLGSDALGDAYAHDVMENQTKVVAGLLRRGVPVMVITGLNDAKDTNVIGVRRWIANMRWPGATRYDRSANTRWSVAGTVLGYRRIGGGLTTLEVLNAGHLSPRDQPLISSALADFMAASPRG